jgi:dTDP-4-amino-4,6-dideoxygalactose transaminase
VGREHAVGVQSCTDALYFALRAHDIGPGKTVICPALSFLSTATAIKRTGAAVEFVDVGEDGQIGDIGDIKADALVYVNLYGNLADYDRLKQHCRKNKILLIEDAAQSLGSKYNKKEIAQYADFTIFSFQAIKHITSGDGGALCFKNKKLLKKALRLRWFGIDREKKQNGTWENDITEIGYKYQMTDIAARLLIDSIKDFKFIRRHRNEINKIYLNYFKRNQNIRILSNTDNKADSCIWLVTIITDKKDHVQKELRKLNIESNQVHFRNDKYSIFKKFINKSKFKNMQNFQNKYLVLPCHTNMTLKQAKFIAESVNQITK